VRDWWKKGPSLSTSHSRFAILKYINATYKLAAEREVAYCISSISSLYESSFYINR
jgi:hypothetical protein